MAIEFRILGPIEAADDGVPIRLGGPKQRAVLTILLLQANRVVPVEHPIAELLAVARARLTRTWTPDECRAYLPGGRCPAGGQRRES